MRIWSNNRNERKLTDFLAQANKGSGIHGIEHWERVELFGRLLMKQSMIPTADNGGRDYRNADLDVVVWFAYLHDCMRENDFADPQHGPRAAAYIDTIRTSYLSELSDEQVALLKKACALHTSTHRTGDITVDTCFDADRLDLPRVGCKLEPERMATEIGAFYAGRGYDGNIFCAKNWRTIKPIGNMFRNKEQSEKLNQDVRGIAFHDAYVKTSPESRFGVRFLKMSVEGFVKSPYFPSGQWNLDAKSLESLMPFESIITEYSNGVFLVDYDQCKIGKSIYISRTIKDRYYMLIEYSPDNVVSECDIEIAVSQCNVLYTADSNTFFQKMDDGSLERMMHEFAREKQFMPERSFAKPIVREKEKLSRFHREFKVDQELVFKGMYYGSFLINRTGIGDIIVLQWFLSIVSWKGCYGADSGKVMEILSGLRDTHLSHLDDDNMRMLHKAVCLECASDKSDIEPDGETDIYRDALTLGYFKVNSLTFRADMMRTDAGRRICINKNSGIVMASTL